MSEQASKLTAQLCETLFTSGDGRKFDRLVLFVGYPKDPRARGGWSKEAVRYQINSALGPIREALIACKEDAEHQMKADCPGVAPDWYGSVCDALALLETKGGG